jgi:branched-chain amino acid transport system ATP-binding protein
VAVPLLELRNITCRFGGLIANNDLTFDVGRGEIVGLIGPNGAGKSTLFNVIAGATQPNEGTVSFEGTNITMLKAPARCAAGIARTFQVVRSFDSMSVLDNIVVGALARNISTRSARQKAEEILDFVGLSGRTSSAAIDLTPPEKRRLELARAIATEPKLLLLDEVLTGLTPVEAQQGADLIKLVRSRGVTVIMVEHVMEVVMPLVDRAIVLDLGRVIASGTPAEVVAKPAVIAAYLGDRRRA